MDLLSRIKSHIALAMVESIFRRAGFALTPVSQREVPPHLGRDDLPDFSALRLQAESGPSEERTWLVEVRYRPDLAHYLAIETQRGPKSVFVQAKRYWPGLIFVFFTDYPAPGRSYFQLLDLESWSFGRPLAAVNLFDHTGLHIYRQNVEEHEVLARRMLTLFWGVP